MHDAPKTNRAVLSITAPRIELAKVEAEKNALPKNELELVIAEVRGKREPLNETEELLDSSLRSLQEELEVSQSDAYKQALDACPEYVNSGDFRLMFLRAAKFKAKEAARRMEKYWEARLRLFGDQIAFESRPIRATDLSEDDLASLHSRGIQLLPRKDKAGRALMIVTRSKFSFQSREDISRLLWYLFHVALEDEDVQKNGVVILGYSEGSIDIRDYDRKLNKVNFELVSRILPVRVVALHHFFDSKIMELILPLLLFLMGGELRLRYEQHSIARWDADRFLENLEKFGITAEMLPIWMKGGTIDFDSEQWLGMRRTKEAT